MRMHPLLLNFHGMNDDMITGVANVKAQAAAGQVAELLFP